jgi:Protein of unknown function (DUF2958)
MRRSVKNRTFFPQPPWVQRTRWTGSQGRPHRACVKHGSAAQWVYGGTPIDNDQGAIDFKPVVKFFTPDAQCTWLLTELDPDHELAFGLCDLGLGCPELGYVSFTELRTVRGELGLPIERDEHFDADKTLSAYADAVRQHGHVVT